MAVLSAATTATLHTVSPFLFSFGFPSFGRREREREKGSQISSSRSRGGKKEGKDWVAEVVEYIEVRGRWKNRRGMAEVKETDWWRFGKKSRVGSSIERKASCGVGFLLLLFQSIWNDRLPNGNEGRKEKRIEKGSRVIIFYIEVDRDFCIERIVID